jgi:hypothetical protein
MFTDRRVEKSDVSDLFFAAAVTPRGRVTLAKSSFADNSVLSHVLLKSQVHCRAHKSPPIVPGVRQKNPVKIRS